MLQFISGPSEKYTVAEEIQMAIEGGCKWVIMAYDGQSDSDVRETALQITELCRESSTILTFENRPELARELGVHGVWLTDPEIHARKVREELGPEAIIGVEIKSPATAVALATMDIDYASFEPNASLESLIERTAEVRDAGCKLPLVAVGDFSSANVKEVMSTGVSGIATGKAIIEAPDPISEIEKMLNLLSE